MQKIPRWTTIAVPVSAGATANTKYPFPDQPLLQKLSEGEPIYIRSMRAYNSTTLSGVPNSPALSICSEADFINATVTLSIAANLRFQDVPLVEMNGFLPDPANYVPGQQFPFMLADLWTVDWTQSYVTLLGNAPTVTAFAYVFGVSFMYQRDFDEMRKKDMDWTDV